MQLLFFVVKALQAKLLCSELYLQKVLFKIFQKVLTE